MKLASAIFAATLSLSAQAEPNKNDCNGTQQEILARVKRLVVPKQDGELQSKCHEATMYFANRAMAPLSFMIHADGVIRGCTLDPDGMDVTCTVPKDALKDKEKSWNYFEEFYMSKTKRKST